MIASIFFFTHWLIVARVAYKVVTRRLPVGTSLAWIMIVAILPVVGIAGYYLIGDHRIGRKRSKGGDIVRSIYQNRLGTEEGAVDHTHPKLPLVFAKIAAVAAQETGFHVRADNDIKIFNQPRDIFNHILRDISVADHICHMEFYIVDPQGRVIDVFEEMIKAAARGVSCKILADHIGSKSFFDSDWPQKLEAAGIEVVASLPVGIIKSYFTRSDLRNHRKIIVVDRLVSYTGSFNLADPEKFNADKDVGQWIDILVRIEGDASESLSVVFNTDFVMDTQGETEVLEIPQLDPVHPEFEPIAPGNVLAQIIPSGPEMLTSVIYETIVSAIYAAQKSILITTPYLVPDESLLLAITNAARRGVDVKLIVPKRVDSLLVHHASRSFFEELVESGIKLYEFSAGLLHTKSIVIDDEVAYLGTVNLDVRSFYLNLEITIAIYDRKVCKDMRKIINEYLDQSEVICIDAWQSRTAKDRLLENVFRLASPLL